MNQKYAQERKNRPGKTTKAEPIGWGFYSFSAPILANPASSSTNIELPIPPPSLTIGGISIAFSLRFPARSDQHSTDLHRFRQSPPSSDSENPQQRSEIQDLQHTDEAPRFLRTSYAQARSEQPSIGGRHSFDSFQGRCD
ncbi:hypothetical protein NL676_010333 [Syzygium grande]|nr:hypothetical protein NL676_010333 [Syzygium grande]